MCDQVGLDNLIGLLLFEHFKLCEVELCIGDISEIWT